MNDSNESPEGLTGRLSGVRVVLVRTTHPGNIGGAARAMLNMGLDELVLVAPRAFPDEQATRRAVGAENLLERARVVETLPEAISDCGFVVATSARPRSLGDEPLTPPEAARELIEAQQHCKVAIVFGNEKSGLDNHELELCHVHTLIPANPDYASLNLAAAVQLYCWELRRLLIESPRVSLKQGRPQFGPATHRQMEDLYVHLEDVLLRTGFLDPNNPKMLMRRLRQLINRSRPDQNEVAILRGILTSVERTKRRGPRLPNAVPERTHD